MATNTPIAYAVNFKTNELRAYTSTNLANATLVTDKGEPDLNWGVYVDSVGLLADKGCKLDSLVAIYNANVTKLADGKPLAKFEHRTAASERLFALFGNLVAGGAVPVVTGKAASPPRDATAEVGGKGKGKGKGKPAKAAKAAKGDGKAAAKGDAKAAKATAAPRASTKGTARGGFKGCIIVVRKPYMTENPRREGTAGNLAFELLRKAGGRMGYEAYLQAGGAGNHALWDWLHGFTEIEQADGTMRQRPAKPMMHGKPVKYTAVHA